MVIRSSFLLLGSLLLGVQAASVQADEGGKRIAKDPNERVCEEITTVGSRLATKRVCATRAEWKETRRLDREAVDTAQRQAADPCKMILTHSGPATC